MKNKNTLELLALFLIFLFLLFPTKEISNKETSEEPPKLEEILIPLNLSNKTNEITMDKLSNLTSEEIKVLENNKSSYKGIIRKINHNTRIINLETNNSKNVNVFIDSNYFFKNLETIKDIEKSEEITIEGILTKYTQYEIEIKEAEIITKKTESHQN